mmetsp:Transcript_10973/g.34002  ORF Transcript_10973/g.34002 Transcript_10973/m.34002 type:complete len:258 (+) Transcript_10973:1843-2616(+)
MLDLNLPALLELVHVAVLGETKWVPESKRRLVTSRSLEAVHRLRPVLDCGGRRLSGAMLDHREPAALEVHDVVNCETREVRDRGQGRQRRKGRRAPKRGRADGRRRSRLRRRELEDRADVGERAAVREQAAEAAVRGFAATCRGGRGGRPGLRLPLLHVGLLSRRIAVQLGLQLGEEGVGPDAVDVPKERHRGLEVTATTGRGSREARPAARQALVDALHVGPARRSQKAHDSAVQRGQQGVGVVRVLQEEGRRGST